MGHGSLIGRTFRGCRIERLLASGGMGAVYLARDESLPNVRKVIKVLIIDPDLDPQLWGFVQQRFEREALAVSVLDHENIVKIHAVGTIDDDGPPCMLMDYVEGQTLHEFTQSYPGGRVPPHRVLPPMCHVARGLDAAHALGIVHRDLKPANVMLRPRDNDPAFCVLLDFGTAKFTRPIVGRLAPTMSGLAIGTPSYMAVEQFRHAEDATPLSDVYALAIMVWEMVTGDLPWGRHDTSSALGVSKLYELQRDRPPLSPPAGTLPAIWEQALRWALSPNPDDRPPSVRHLLVELAVGLEPAGPHVRSGVEILRHIAPKFISESEPDAETLREQPHRTIVVAWPRAETRVATADLPTRPALVQPGQQTMNLRGDAAHRTPVMPATPTTLGAANGVLPTMTAPPSGWKLAVLAVIAAAVTTVGLYAILNGRDRHATSEPPSSSATKPVVENPSSTPIAPAGASVSSSAAGESSSQPTPSSSPATRSAGLPAPPPPMPVAPGPGSSVAPSPTVATTPVAGDPTAASGVGAASSATMPVPPPSAASKSRAGPVTPTGSRHDTRSPASDSKKSSDDQRGKKRKYDPEAAGGGVEE